MTADEIAATLALHGLVGLSGNLSTAQYWEGVACTASQCVVCKYVHEHTTHCGGGWLDAAGLAIALKAGILKEMRIVDLPTDVLVAAYKVFIEGEPHD